MKNNSLQDLLISFKELKRQLSIIKARQDTEHNLPEKIKYQLWIEEKQVEELIRGMFYGADHV